MYWPEEVWSDNIDKEEEGDDEWEGE